MSGINALLGSTGAPLVRSLVSKCRVPPIVKTSNIRRVRKPLGIRANLRKGIYPQIDWTPLRVSPVTVARGWINVGDQPAFFDAHRPKVTLCFHKGDFVRSTCFRCKNQGRYVVLPKANGTYLSRT